MAAWFLISKYFKSSDADKIKQRLTAFLRDEVDKWAQAVKDSGAKAE